MYIIKRVPYYTTVLCYSGMKLPEPLNLTIYMSVVCRGLHKLVAWWDSNPTSAYDHAGVLNDLVDTTVIPS